MKSLFRRQPVSSRRSSHRNISRLSLEAPVDKTFGTPGLALVRIALLGATTALAWVLVSSVALKKSPVAQPEIDEAVRSLDAEFTSEISQLEPLQTFQLTASANEVITSAGNSIRLNGQTLAGAWQQRDGRLGLSSVAVSTLIGAELLSTTDASQQPIRWFPTTQDEISYLPAWWDSTNRYIDVTDFAARSGWTTQAAGSTLQVGLPTATVSGVRQGKQTWGDRIVVDLSGPTTWQVESSDIFTIKIAGVITPQMVSGFKAAKGNLITQLDVAPLSGHTIIKVKTKGGASPQVWSTGNPARVVIDIRKDAMVERDVAWANGLRWRQQYVNVGASRFPVYMFIAKPDPTMLSMRPIRSNPSSAIGIAPIVNTAQQQRAAGAVNAGFFNRNNQLPLGAVRNAGQWLSGPILGRGAMAWNDQGDLMMDRLALLEVVSAAGKSFPVLALNSGYVQAGIGRYTSDWGATYSSIVDGEIVVTVRNDVVTDRQTIGKAGSRSLAIPSDGYLLSFRSNSGNSLGFTNGTQIGLASQSQPSAFDQYPNVMGGGPLLIRDRSIVLNPQLEGFSTNFIQGSAPRTAVGKTADGTWIIATMHDRVGGRGPNLAETAQIMQQLGSVDALNLDGGSSSSLYLGGQLLNRPPQTAARVNNGIGLFILGRE
ncbi:MAG: phosphodiester glycosidase family protein [Phormidesmis sp.]